MRSVELTKREWVLNGDTVQYTSSCMIKDTLEYDFDRERKFKYKGLSEDAFVEHFATFISGIWQIHPFREGNTRTVALFAIKYLRSLGYQASNDLFAEKFWYFRNALVRANYENVRLQIEKTQLPLEEFFKVLLFGCEMELRNRYLRVGQEYGTKTAEAVGEIHRQDVRKNDVINFSKSPLGQFFVIQNCRRRLADILGVKQRQAQRIVASLKKKANLTRRGARKNGEWHFEE